MGPVLRTRAGAKLPASHRAESPPKNKKMSKKRPGKAHGSRLRNLWPSSEDFQKILTPWSTHPVTLSFASQSKLRFKSVLRPLKALCLIFWGLKVPQQWPHAVIHLVCLYAICCGKISIPGQPVAPQSRREPHGRAFSRFFQSPQLHTRSSGRDRK